MVSDGEARSELKVFENERTRYDGPAIIVCFATRGTVAVETFASALRDGFGGLPIVLLISARKDVDVARNELARTALALIRRPHMLPWDAKELLVFWFDDDSFWTTESFTRAIQYMESCPQIDLLCGNYCAREEFAASSALPKSATRDDHSADGAVEIDITGWHWVIHRASVLERVGPDPFSPIDDIPEDISFCKRANAAGIRMFMAKEIVIAHIDVERGVAFLPGHPAWRSNGTSLIPPDQQRQKQHSYGVTLDAARERRGIFAGSSILTEGGE